MPRQNRVTPWGEIIATPARGSLMGNRGCLHNEQGQLVRAYQGQRWLICQLQFKGRHRALMTPGRYTELFFLDEATALAAGHRPCQECSRPRYQEFAAAWAQANPDLAGGPAVKAGRLDHILHAERLSRRQKVTYPAQLASLPRGCFIAFEGQRQPYLVLEDKLLPWQPAGYGPAIARPVDQVVQVLTPPSLVRTLAYGYEPAMLLPAIARVADAALVETPVIRQHERRSGHGWVDYWAAYDGIDLYIELKHG
jgi:hypothetical protein